MRPAHALLFAALLAQGCATMFSPEHARIPVTSTPTGAHVFIDGQAVGTTPLILKLDNHREYHLLVRMPGRQDRATVLRTKTDGLWVVIDLMLGIVPAIIDAATGAWSEIEVASVHVPFDPDTSTVRAKVGP